MGENWVGSQFFNPPSSRENMLAVILKAGLNHANSGFTNEIKFVGNSTWNQAACFVRVCLRFNPNNIVPFLGSMSLQNQRPRGDAQKPPEKSRDWKNSAYLHNIHYIGYTCVYSVYIYTYVCIYIYMYICMYVYMYVRYTLGIYSSWCFGSQSSIEKSRLDGASHSLVPVVLPMGFPLGKWSMGILYPPCWGQHQLDILSIPVTWSYTWGSMKTDASSRRIADATHTNVRCIYIYISYMYNDIKSISIIWNRI